MLLDGGGRWPHFSRGGRQFIQVLYHLKILAIVDGGNNRFCGIDLLFMDTLLHMRMIRQRLGRKMMRIRSRGRTRRRSYGLD